MEEDIQDDPTCTSLKTPRTVATLHRYAREDTHKQYNFLQKLIQETLLPVHAQETGITHYCVGESQMQ